MNKTLKSIFCMVLLSALALSLVLPVMAAEETEPAEPAKSITINSMEDFIQFSKDCVRDVYSQDLTVFLETDLDFSGMEFQAVPTFSGTFLGQRHIIKGIKLETEGSYQGIFRYLTKTARVENLTVFAEITPEGSSNRAGGIAGSNAGLIKNCGFKGSVSGTESIGGIAGVNEVSGIIEDCMVSGTIRGAHFAGGLAGENFGVIRKCKNLAAINTKEDDNKIEKVSFDPEFLLGKEAVQTVTDLGGIAGTTTGVIRDCTNHGNVGYPHMGYNLGGICGSQKGYVTGCKNRGKIQGRKEIGGIAGQQEPVVQIDYTEDTLQILRRQLATTSALADRASANIKSNTANLSADLSNLHNQAQTAIEAVTNLIPSGGEWPDADTIHAAHNTLASSVGSMEGSIGNINQSAQSVIGTAAGDIRAINNSINAISHTLDTAAEHLGGTITDISDQDTPEDITGKIQDCHNAGSVFGDLNVGGIIGAAAWENDLQPDDDYTVTGNRSMNFDSRLRAVILECSNSGRIEAKKRYAGGIAGNLTLGLIKNCQNTGEVQTENADYVGGIAGTSLGFIRDSNAKCKLKGHSYIGGIAGSASIVSGCRSTVMIEDGAERLGSVLGKDLPNRTDTDTPITGNYYLPLADHLGAIDGIDYYGIADSLKKNEFLALPDLSSIFFSASMTFQYPDGSTQKLTVPLGDVVPESRIPAPPRKEGYYGKWDQLEDLDLNHMFFDVTLEADYIPTSTVLESDVKNKDGKPVLLAEGIFGTQKTVELQKNEQFPEDRETAESWLLPDFGTDEDTVIHLAVPAEVEADCAKVLVLNEADQWVSAEAQLDGSYLILTVKPGDQAVSVYESHVKQISTLTILCAGAALVIFLIVLLILRRKRIKRKQKKAEAMKQAKDSENE